MFHLCPHNVENSEAILDRCAVWLLTEDISEINGYLR